MQTDDLVNVLVPRRHLAQVYGFIARLDASDGHLPQATAEDSAAGPTKGAEASAADNDWTQPRLRRMVKESPPALLAILKALAKRPGEWLPMSELAKAIRPDADWNTVAGTLGAFGRRVKSRYGLETWPFENKFDHEVNGRVCRMSEERAREIKRLISER